MGASASVSKKKNNQSTIVPKVIASELPPIRLIDFADFINQEGFPRCPQCMDICVNLNTINREESFIVFISHCWLRGWKGAAGWNGRPHPDNEAGDKYKLCVKGIEWLSKALAPGMKKTYIWLDFGCMNQDSNPAGELKQLDEIIKSADCIFTPVPGVADLPTQYSDFYDDYKVDAWNGDVVGYINRCWCRVEMFYAANIPVVNNSIRIENFKAGLKRHATNGVRPHIIYGMREIQTNGSPYLLPPLQNSYYTKLDPVRGHITVESDRTIIERLIKELQPYMKSTVSGYEGDLVNGEWHGKGIYKFEDGGVYEGEFSHNQFHGKGKFIYPAGDIYEGDYVKGKREGKGLFTYSTGITYDGDYWDDHMEGKGYLKYPDGNEFFGDFVRGVRCGKGQFTYSNGSVYIGEFKSDLRNGMGVITHSNGERYEGEFTNDLMNGKGKFLCQDGGIYEGEFVNDRYHGMGKFSYSTGEVYEGQFDDCQRHGKGVIKLSNGDLYEGDFVREEMSGKGKYTFVSGDIYEGEMNLDEMNGRGVLRYANGNMFEGKFDENKQTNGIFIFAGEEIRYNIEYSGLDSEENKRIGDHIGKVVYDVVLRLHDTEWKRGKMAAGELLSDEQCIVPNAQ
jgi:hypothetical protein